MEKWRLSIPTIRRPTPSRRHQLSRIALPPRASTTDETILGRLEHFIHPLSAFVVLPIFAFCAAGVSFEGLSLASAGGVAAAVALALALGKPLGVFLFAWLAARLTRMPLPFKAHDLISVGCLCGIGFTMSLFIGGLAFAGDEASEAAARLGVLMGSMLSLALAAVAFRIRRNANKTTQQ